MSAPVVPEPCPKCGVDLAYEVDGYSYTRRIGVEVQGVYDGVLYWLCPFCDHRWNRWPEDHSRHAVAAEYMQNHALAPKSVV